MVFVTESLLNQLPYELNSNSLLYLSLFGFISIFFVLKFTRRRKLNLPPSPPKLPIIGNLHQLGTLPHRSFQALSKEYGPIMFLQLGQTPTLVISSPEVVKEIFKNHDVAFSNRHQSTAAKIFLYGCKEVGFAQLTEEWRQKRKICVVELLSHKRVRSFHSIRQLEVAELVDNIREACASKRSSVNLSEMVIAASNNIVSRCVLGQKYDTVDGTSSFGELGRKVMQQFTAFCVGDFFPSMGWIDIVRGLVPDIKATLGALDVFLDEVIAEHKKSMKRGDDQSDNKDFVDILLQLEQDGKLEFELTRDILKSLLVDMFVGGSDTTSTALEWVFAELMKNPKAMKKAQEEVRRVVGRKSEIDENDVNQMNYLKCVIKETLRLHPPISLITRETSSGVKLKGYDIPPKTRVFVNAWAIQRDPKFWDSPEEFLPERFENSQVDFKGQDLLLIPFGNGRRGCPGITFGVASSEYVLANLLYWFDWKLPENGVAVQDLDMSESFGLSVSKTLPLHLKPILYSFQSKN